MFERFYEKEFQGVTVSQVWETWKKVDEWPEWQNDLLDCKLRGEFAAGNIFFLWPKGMKAALPIELTEVKEGESFTDCTTFFGARMYDTHGVLEAENGVKLTSRLSMKGPLAFLWFFLVGMNVSKSIPAQTEAVILRARTKK